MGPSIADHRFAPAPVLLLQITAALEKGGEARAQLAAFLEEVRWQGKGEGKGEGGGRKRKGGIRGVREEETGLGGGRGRRARPECSAVG